MNTNTVKVGGAKKGALTINLAELLAKADRDSDGKFSQEELELRSILSDMDTDHDGQLELHEIINVGIAKKQDKATIKNMKKLVLAIIFLSFLFCGVMIGLMVLANEASKDSKPASSGQLETTSGKPLTTGESRVTATLRDVLKFTPAQMKELKEITISDPIASQGYSVYQVTVVAVRSNPPTVSIRTATNELLVISEDAIQVWDSKGTGTSGAETRRRQMLDFDSSSLTRDTEDRALVFEKPMQEDITTLRRQLLQKGGKATANPASAANSGMSTAQMDASQQNLQRDIDNMMKQAGLDMASLGLQAPKAMDPMKMPAMQMPASDAADMARLNAMAAKAQADYDAALKALSDMSNNPAPFPFDAKAAQKDYDGLLKAMKDVDMCNTCKTKLPPFTIPPVGTPFTPKSYDNLIKALTNWKDTNPNFKMPDFKFPAPGKGPGMGPQPGYTPPSDTPAATPAAPAPAPAKPAPAPAKPAPAPATPAAPAATPASVYNCQADTGIGRMAGGAWMDTSDVKLSNGKSGDKGFTKAQCEAECASKAACASFIYGSYGGSTTYCELWSKTTGSGKHSGTIFCTPKPAPAPAKPAPAPATPAPTCQTSTCRKPADVTPQNYGTGPGSAAADTTCTTEGNFLAGYIMSGSGAEGSKTASDCQLKCAEMVGSPADTYPTRCGWWKWEEYKFKYSSKYKSYYKPTAPTHTCTLYNDHNGYTQNNIANMFYTADPLNPASVRPATDNKWPKRGNDPNNFMGPNCEKDLAKVGRKPLAVPKNSWDKEHKCGYQKYLGGIVGSRYAVGAKYCAGFDGKLMKEQGHKTLAQLGG